MNVFQGKTDQTYTSKTVSSEPSSYQQGFQDYLAGLGLFAFFAIAITLFIFITWLRAMLAMIHLDQRFDEFFDEYKYQQDRINPLPGDEARTRRPTVINPIEDESDGKRRLVLSSSKTSKEFTYAMYSVGGLLIIAVIFLIILSVIKL